jgi:DNA topoisomerase IB
MIIRHVRDGPVRPSQLAELDVPPALDEVILGCLAKDPADRPGTAWVFRDRLRGVAAELPEWSERRAEQWWGIHVPGE